MADDGYLYRIDKPGTDYHFNYGIPVRQLAGGSRVGVFAACYVVGRFIEDMRLLTNPSR